MIMKPPVTTPSSPRLTRRGRKPEDGSDPKGQSRPQRVAETIKEWILKRGLLPGDRLPQEHQLIEQLGVSKGTTREALKVMETEGLIRTRTGPGGGAFITEVSEDKAGALLANHFFFKDLSIADIYETRIALEPQLVHELALEITPTQIDELRGVMREYSEPPSSIEDERRQRNAELGFHEFLARFSRNPLLSFYCIFLVRLLKDLTVCKRIYSRSNPELRERGVSYQEQLIEAFRLRDAEAARATMEAHMRAAQRIMLEQEAEVKKGFL